MKELKITQTYTTRTQSVDAYLKMIHKEPMVGPEEEVTLAERIHKGDKRALDKLVRANLRFAFSIAKQYQNRGLDIMDLIDEANYGLIIAAQRFDETRGFKFISYAVWWIRQQILLSLSEHSNIVRKPLNHINYINKVNQAMLVFEQLNERKPSVSELAEMTDLPESKVQFAIEGNQRATSIEAPFNENDSNSLLEVLPSNVPAVDNQLMCESLSTDIQNILNKLTFRDKRIICMFFGIGGREYSLEEIGYEFNLSRERVRQIKERIISTLRKDDNSKKLLSYLA